MQKNKFNLWKSACNSTVKKLGALMLTLSLGVSGHLASAQSNVQQLLGYMDKLIQDVQKMEEKASNLQKDYISKKMCDEDVRKELGGSLESLGNDLDCLLGEISKKVLLIKQIREILYMQTKDEIYLQPLDLSTQSSYLNGFFNPLNGFDISN